MVLFDLGRFASFQSIDLRKLSEDDALWAIHVLRRKESLVAEKNRRSPAWAARWAAYLFETGSYAEALDCSSRVLDPANGPCDDQTLLSASALRCRCEFAMGKGKIAKNLLEQFESRYEGSLDLFTQGTLAFVRGTYLAGGATEEENAYLRAQQHFKTAARRFELCGRIELAILARIELASSLATLGGYIGAIKEIELAMDVASEARSFLYVGRMLVIGAAAAGDQGYRKSVEATVLRGIEWCDFVGDFWGRIHGLYALARLRTYQMPEGDDASAEAVEKLYLQVIEEAEQKGAAVVAAHATASLAWMYVKAGADERRQRLIDRENERISGPRPHFDGMFKNAGDVVRTVSQRVADRLQDGIATYPDGFFIFNPRKDHEHRCIDYLAEYQNERARRIHGSRVDAMFLYSEVQENIYLKDLAEALFEATERHISYQDLISVPEESGEYWYTRRIVPSGDGAILIIRDVTAQQRLRIAAEHPTEAEDAIQSAIVAALDQLRAVDRVKLDAPLRKQIDAVASVLADALDRL